MSELSPAQNRKLSAQLESWQASLVNLNRRNRLLNFSHTRNNSFEIVEPGMDEIFATLQRSGWVFMAPEEPIGDTKDAATGAVAHQGLRKPNELWVGNKTAARLERDLKSLDAATRQTALDTGMWILYLGFGVLRWSDGDGDDWESPLLLHPVQLTRKGKAERFTLEPADEDLSINPSLAVKLETDFGIVLPTTAEIELTPKAVCDAVKARLRKSGQSSWSVEDRVVMARFSFHKEAMYRDLIVNESLISEHPMIQLMGLGRSAEGALPGIPDYPDSELDSILPPEELMNIRDADSTQRRCVLAARDGVSFVMDGPPGTGKSQTIVNIIAELLHAGRSVLFVSEKAAALDVVYNRLEEANLTNFVLKLHSHDATRKEVINELGRALEERPRAVARFTPTDRQNLVQVRNKLTDYVVAMNEIRQPLGISLHFAIGRVALLHDLPRPPIPQKIDRDLTAAGFSTIQDAADRLSRAWGPVTRGDDFIWRDLAEKQVSSAFEQTALARVATASDSLKRLEFESRNLAGQCSCPYPTNAQESQALEALVEAATRHPHRDRVPVEWLTMDDISPIGIEIRDRQARVEETLAARETMVSIVGPSWEDLALPEPATMRSADKQLKALAAPAVRQFGLLQTDDAIAVLADAIARLDAIDEDVQDIAGAFGDSSGNRTFARTRTLSDLAGHIGASTPPEGSWLNPLAQLALSDALAALIPLVEGFRRQRDSLQETFTDEVLELDIDSIRSRLASASGFGKLAGPYRESKRLLAPCVISGKVNKAVIAQLDDVAAWKHVHDQLERQEETHASLLGRY